MYQTWASIFNIVTFFLDKPKSGVAPHFVQTLKPQTACLDQPLLLKCIVSGKPTPVIKWFCNNTEIIPDERRHVTYNPETGVSALKILNPVQSDECVYSIQALNAFGRAECRANLTLGLSFLVISYYLYSNN